MHSAEVMALTDTAEARWLAGTAKTQEEGGMEKGRVRLNKDKESLDLDA